MIELSKVFLLSVGILLFLEMQAVNGIEEKEMLMAGIITAIASALRKELRKKRCTIQLLPGKKVLRISDFGRRSDKYFYRRFRFLKQHLIELMKAIGLAFINSIKATAFMAINFYRQSALIDFFGNEAIRASPPRDRHSSRPFAASQMK